PSAVLSWVCPLRLSYDALMIGALQHGCMSAPCGSITAATARYIQSPASVAPRSCAARVSSTSARLSLARAGAKRPAGRSTAAASAMSQKAASDTRSVFISVCLGEERRVLIHHRAVAPVECPAMPTPVEALEGRDVVGLAARHGGAPRIGRFDENRVAVVDHELRAGGRELARGLRLVAQRLHGAQHLRR